MHIEVPDAALDALADALAERVVARLPDTAAPAPQDDRAYSVDDVSALTGLSDDSVRRAIKRGELQASKRGGRVLILRDDYRAWIAAGRIAPDQRAESRLAAAAARRQSRPTHPSRLRAIEDAQEP